MRGLISILATATVAVVVFFSPAAAAQNDPAQAGDTTPDQPVEAKGSGIAGGIMLGAEVVLLVESAIGVEPVWPWVVFPIVGAAGGGVGGYFAEKAKPAAGVGMLIGAMALLIPTAVAISVSTAYDPADEGAVEGGSGGGSLSFDLGSEGDLEGGTSTEVEARPEEMPEGGGLPPEGDVAPEPEPEPESPAPLGEDESSVRLGHLRSGALFHVDRQLDAGFGLPAIDFRPTALDFEQQLHGINPGLEIHLPLLRIDLP